MKRLTALILLALPIAVAATETVVVDTLPGRLECAIVHVRMPRQVRGWSMQWGDGYEARIERLGRAVDDDLYQPQLRVSVSRGDSLLLAADVEAKASETQPGSSLKLIYDGFGARLYAGDELQMPVGEIPFDADAPTAIRVTTDRKVDPSQCRVIYRQRPTVEMSQYATTDRLTAAIEASDDPAAGFWTYLDRNVDEARATVGGTYQLAIVPTGDELEIVYLGGARIAADAWQPLRLKGRLRRTAFIDTYDLEWYDADGRLLSEDTFATLAGNVLTLSFPLHATTLRLTKASRSPGRR